MNWYTSRIRELRPTMSCVRQTSARNRWFSIPNCSNWRAFSRPIAARLAIAETSCKSSCVNIVAALVVSRYKIPSVRPVPASGAHTTERLALRSSASPCPLSGPAFSRIATPSSSTRRKIPWLTCTGRSGPNDRSHATCERISWESSSVSKIAPRSAGITSNTRPSNCHGSDSASRIEPIDVLTRNSRLRFRAMRADCGSAAIGAHGAEPEPAVARQHVDRFDARRGITAVAVAGPGVRRNSGGAWRDFADRRRFPRDSFACGVGPVIGTGSAGAREPGNFTARAGGRRCDSRKRRARERARRRRGAKREPFGVVRAAGRHRADARDFVSRHNECGDDVYAGRFAAGFSDCQPGGDGSGKCAPVRTVGNGKPAVARGSLPDARHGGAKLADARGVPVHRAGGAERFDGADSRRERNGEGAGGAGDSQEQSAEEPPVRGAELRGVDGNAARKRVVRA